VSSPISSVHGPLEGLDGVLVKMSNNGRTTLPIGWTTAVATTITWFTEAITTAKNMSLPTVLETVNEIFVP